MASCCCVIHATCILPQVVQQRCCSWSAIFVGSRAWSRVPARSSVHHFLLRYIPSHHYSYIINNSAMFRRMCRVSRLECFRAFFFVGSPRICAGEAFAVSTATKTCSDTMPGGIMKKKTYSDSVKNSAIQSKIQR